MKIEEAKDIVAQSELWLLAARLEILRRSTAADPMWAKQAEVALEEIREKS